MNTEDKFIRWAISRHERTNHYYDGEMGEPTALPYSYHLGLAKDALFKFKDYIEHEWVEPHLHVRFEVLEYACWAHDTLEDTRTTYSQIKDALRRFTNLNKEEIVQCVEIIRAVTNYSRGRNREERMPDECYLDIIQTPGAIIIKLCDRIANLKHGLIKGSNQKSMYKKEYPKFKEWLYGPRFKPMFDYIEKLIDTEL